MALTVIIDGLEVESGLSDTEWYRWRSPADGRCWAARTRVPASLLSTPMIVSADSGEDLERALAAVPPIGDETTARPEALIKRRRALGNVLTSVKAARGFAGEVLSDVAGTDADHVDAVVLVVAELVTNALRYGAEDEDNVWLDVEIYEKWTIVGVDDRDPQVYPSRHDPDDVVRLSGRGREIVEFLSARTWWTRRNHSKTAFAVILRTGVSLDARDLALLDRLERDTASPPPTAVEEQPPPAALRRPPSYAPAARPEIAADAGDEPVGPGGSGSGPA